ncbi:hypothetical protein QR680_004180 [Steinernema hermaphroditum]|uniref:Uncharacterized protein n=1 Tax=Steinernema hermaphroditum TaxID=289476 RepID=A0AA39HMW2_9BILA|nr:hypothetical protein QR680_004180 [Steinernema hermaphroditum]
MARLTLALLLTAFVAFVAISVSKPVFIVSYNAAYGDELDLSSLPTPDEVMNLNSTEELMDAIQGFEAEKVDNSTAESQRKVILIVM